MSDSEQRNKKIGDAVETTSALMAIRDERLRQISVEGWSPEHDDEHNAGEMADAAAAYVWPYIVTVQSSGVQYSEAVEGEILPISRPDDWDDRWWKPTNRRRDLVKAGALIVAEIERLDRAKNAKNKSH